jgi:integrase
MKNLSTSIQRRKRGKRTEYIARLTYYDKAGKRKGVSKSAPTSGDAKRELQDLIDQHIEGGSKTLDARNMTFASLAAHCKETRYCDAFYDEQGRKLYGVREPKKFASIINRLVTLLGHLKLSDITVSHLEQYRRTRLSTKTNRGTYTDVATVNRELSTCRALLNDAVVNDWLLRSPFAKAKKGELIAIAHEAKRQVVLSSEDEEKLLTACNTSKRRHLKAMIIAAIDTGCRQGELRRLRWSDVDLQANSLRVTSYKGKTVNKRFVPVTDRLRAALLDLRAKPSVAAFRKLRTGEATDNTLVFGIVDSIKKSFDAARIEAGLAHIRFHDLRHTAGTFLAQGGMNIGLVAEILGHSDPKTTQRYINVTADTVKAARDILNGRRQVTGHLME